MHRNIDRRGDADFDHVAVQAHDLDRDAAINHNAFARLSGKDEHKRVG